jgi:predicted acetyltransferase
MELVKPSVEFEDPFMKGAGQIIAAGDSNFIQPELWLNGFASYCDTLNGYALGLNLPEGYVSGTHLWLMENQAFIGRLSIRHELNDSLLKMGGHIGYVIVPQYRKMGYGAKMLALGLTEAAKLGLKKVLVTCDNTNIASAKIIEKNGGVFENELYAPDKGVFKRRYWISL